MYYKQKLFASYGIVSPVKKLAGAPFTKNGLTLIPAWISKHIHSKLWDEITYPFLNFNGCTIEV